MRTTSVRLAVVAGVAAGVLAACGGSGSATSVGGAPSTSAAAGGASSEAPAGSSSAAAGGAGALDSMSAEDIVKKAVGRLTKASSVRIRGTVSSDGQNIVIDATEVAGKGCQGKLTLTGKGSFQLKIIGKTTWLNPDKAFWTSQGLKDAAALAVVNGKWFKLSPKSDLASMGQLCDLQALLGKEMSGSGASNITKGATTTIGGKPALELKDGGDGSLFVSVEPEPQLLEIASTAGEGKLDFSGYDTAITLTPPPAAKTLDGAKFGM